MILIATATDQLRATCREALHVGDRLIEVHDFASLRELLARLSPRVLVFEMGLQGCSADDCAWLLERCDSLRTVVVGGMPAADEEIAWYLAGVRAVCPTDIDAGALQRVLAAVERGETWMRRALVPQLVARLGRRPVHQLPPPSRKAAGLSGMTVREAQVAQLVAGGYSNKQIARRLAITERTVKFHLSALFRKLGVDDRLTLALHVAAQRQPGLPAPLITSGDAPETSPEPVVPLRRRA